MKDHIRLPPTRGSFDYFSEFRPKKIVRKLDTDGLRSTMTAAGDLFTRKYIGRPVFDTLLRTGVVKSLSREEIETDCSTTAVLGGSVPFVTNFEDGYILSETGLCTTRRGQIIEDTAAEPEQAQQAMMAMISRETFYGGIPTIILKGLITGWSSSVSSTPRVRCVSPLIPRYPTNYYHWMVETVPKVRYLREFEAKTGSEVTVLIPSGGPQFINETLNLLNWPKSKIMPSTHRIYKVQKLVVPSFPDQTATDFDWLRNEILGTISTEKELSDKKEETNVYVSRANAIERRVLNEEEVMNVLSDYGFERYCLENRSLIQNIQLFNQADIIVGPHGAGLTDIIFAEDSTLLELFGEKIKKPYKSLAETLSIDYEPMYCQADSVDIIVDIEKLERRIAKIVEND